MHYLIEQDNKRIKDLEVVVLDKDKQDEYSNDLILFIQNLVREKL